MSFSGDLNKIVTNFQTIDPTQNSVSEKFEKEGKRVWWASFLGTFFHVITCGLIPKNAGLDRTTQKIVSLTKQFLATTENPSHEQLQALEGTFTKLETIVSNNQGSRYSQVHDMAVRITKLMKGEKVEDEKTVEPTLQDLLDKLPSPEELAKEGREKLKVLNIKVKALIEANATNDLINGLNSVHADETKFGTLFTFIIPHFTHEQAIELFSTLKWPSEELKAHGLQNWPTAEQRAQMAVQLEKELNAQDLPEVQPEEEAAQATPEETAHPEQPPAASEDRTLLALINSLDIPDETTEIPQAEVNAKMKQISEVLNKIEALFAAGKQEEVVAAFNHAAQNERLLAGLMRIVYLIFEDKETAAKVLFDNINWPSEESKQKAYAMKWPSAQEKAAMRFTLQTMAASQDTPQIDAVLKQIDELVVPEAITSEEENIAFIESITPLAVTLKALFEKGMIEEVKMAFNHARANEAKFEILVGLVSQICSDHEVAYAVLESLTWPSEETKGAILAQFKAMYQPAEAQPQPDDELVLERLVDDEELNISE